VTSFRKVFRHLYFGEDSTGGRREVRLCAGRDNCTRGQKVNCPLGLAFQ